MFIMLFNSKISNSQDKEIGLMVGVTEYLGELTKKHITYSHSKIGFGVLGRYYFNPRINLKGSLFFGMIEGDDLDWNNYEDFEFKSDEWWNTNWRDKRNLSFKSNIWDASLQLEFNILPFVSGHRIRNWTPYVYTGISLFHFNPKAEYNGTWYALQPLGTEGQNVDTVGAPEPYSLTQISIPYGIGFKYSTRSLWVIGFEVTQRKTMTDYMDDVSGVYWDKDQIEQNAPGDDGAIARALSDRATESNRSEMKAGMNRGNPDKLDTYFWVGFTLSKTIRGKACRDF